MNVTYQCGCRYELLLSASSGWSPNFTNMSIRLEKLCREHIESLKAEALHKVDEEAESQRAAILRDHKHE